MTSWKQRCAGGDGEGGGVCPRIPTNAHGKAALHITCWMSYWATCVACISNVEWRLHFHVAHTYKRDHSLTASEMLDEKVSSACVAGGFSIYWPEVMFSGRSATHGICIDFLWFLELEKIWKKWMWNKFYSDFVTSEFVTFSRPLSTYRNIGMFPSRRPGNTHTQTNSRKLPLENWHPGFRKFQSQLDHGFSQPVSHIL